MSSEPSFWSTLPGVLTGVAAVIAATTGVIAALHKAGVIGRGTEAAAPDSASKDGLLARAGGQWRATVRYDWGAEHEESFRFTVDGLRVLGSATFLGVPRGIEEGTIAAGELRFVTRTRSEMGDESRSLVHEYRATGVGAELSFVLETRGDFASHLPITFSARRVVA